MSQLSNASSPPVAAPHADQPPKQTNSPRDGFTNVGGLPAVPLVIGVVGHRDLRAEDTATLRAALAKIFQQFVQAYPNTPIVLLSSLAEGADQLAAEVAQENGIIVRAPLPFERAVYRQSTSFDTEAARAKLDQFLDSSKIEWFRAPLPRAIDDSVSDWAAVARGENPSLTDVCYVNAGGYIVRHSNLLIALWNEDEKRESPSITGQLVAFKLHGIAPHNYPWLDDHPLGFRGECGPVYIIRTPRTQSATGAPKLPQSEVTASILVPTRKADSAEEPATKSDGGFERLPSETLLARPVSQGLRLGRLAAALAMWGLFLLLRGILAVIGRKPKPRSTASAELWQLQDTFQNLDDINRDVLTKFDGARAKEWLAEFGPPTPKDMPVPMAHWLERLSVIGVAADKLASQLDRTARAGQVIVFVLLALALGFFHIYADTEGHWPVWLLLFFAALLSAELVVQWSKWQRLLERRLDYRALAEALRVRRAWAIAGIGESVADSYLGQLRTETIWVRRALQHVCPPASYWADHFKSLTPAAQQECLQAVQENWVATQLKYYRKAHHREHRWAAFLRLLGYVLAISGWLWIPAMVFTNVMRERHEETGSWFATFYQTASKPEHLWLLISAFLVLGGGLVLAFRERRVHEELANQYERMLVVFRNGAAELDKWRQHGDIGRAQAVVTTLGKEAIAEHAQWTILRRARPLEVHVGG